MLPVAIVKSVPSNVRFDSAVIALVPVPVNTALSVREDAPVPPLATDKSVPLQSPLFTVSLAANPPATPKFVLASPAELAPVPPFATAKSVPLQLQLFIVLAVAKLPNPYEDLVVDAFSKTKLEPLPTIKLLSVTLNPAISCSVDAKVKDKSYGSPSEPVEVSVQLISNPVLS